MEINNELNLKFRHCFLLLAKQIRINEKFYYLKADQAPFGYGSEDSGLSTSKQGTVRTEVIGSNTAIACVPVLEQGDIQGKPIDGRNEESMFYWWTKIQLLMHKDAKTNLYDTFKHNCCTVTYDAIKAVGGHLDRINFSNFNEGYGIIDRDGLSLLNFLGLSSAVSAEISRASANKWLFFKDGTVLSTNNNPLVDPSESSEAAGINGISKSSEPIENSKKTQKRGEENKDEENNSENIGL